MKRGERVAAVEILRANSEQKISGTATGLVGHRRLDGDASLPCAAGTGAPSPFRRVPINEAPVILNNIGAGIARPWGAGFRIRRNFGETVPCYRTVGPRPDPTSSKGRSSCETLASPHPYTAPDTLLGIRFLFLPPGNRQPRRFFNHCDNFHGILSCAACYAEYVRINAAALSCGNGRSDRKECTVSE